ncbi:unnamed protein product [Brassica oleracea var. botrytis]
MGFSGSGLLSDKAQSSDVKNTSSHCSSSTSRNKRDCVPLLGGCSIPNLPIFTVSYPPSCATVLHSANEVCPNSAARTLLVKFRSVEGNADISPSIFSIWARSIPIAKGVGPFSISQNDNFNEKTEPKDLALFNSFSMSLDGFTEPLFQTIVNTMSYHSIQNRSLFLWLSVDSPIPSSKTFSMRSVISPAIKQMKLSKSLTILLTCGAVRTGPEDATDFVSTIFRGVDWLSTSRFNVTKFQLSGFAMNFISTHSSLTQNLLSIYPKGFSTLIIYVVLSLVLLVEPGLFLIESRGGSTVLGTGASAPD